MRLHNSYNSSSKSKLYIGYFITHFTLQIFSLITGITVSINKSYLFCMPDSFYNATIQCSWCITNIEKIINPYIFN